MGLQAQPSRGSEIQSYLQLGQAQTTLLWATRESPSLKVKSLSWRLKAQAVFTEVLSLDASTHTEQLTNASNYSFSGFDTWPHVHLVLPHTF